MLPLCRSLSSSTCCAAEARYLGDYYARSRRLLCMISAVLYMISASTCTMAYAAVERIQFRFAVARSTAPASIPGTDRAPSPNRSLRTWIST